MKLLACFKIVPDLDMIGEGDWLPGESLMPDVKHVRTLWNCFDEGALELLLKFSDAAKTRAQAVHLGALTIGGSGCDSYLKTLYALGYEKAIRVEYEKDLRFVPELVARIIAAYVKKSGPWDVLVTGSQSSEGNNGKTPIIAAEYLGWPCITRVFAINAADENHITVKSMSDQGELVQTLAGPCVLSVGNITDAWLRVPTLKDRMLLGKKPIELLTLEDLGIDESLCGGGVFTELTGLRRTVTKRMGAVLSGGSPEDMARQLYDCFLKERLAKL